ALLQRRRHGYGAGHVFSCLQAGNGLLAMKGDRGVDVDRIDVLSTQNIVIGLVTPLHAELVTDPIEVGSAALTECDQFYVRVVLVDGNELRTESQTNQRNPHRHDVPSVLIASAIARRLFIPASRTAQ